MQYSTKELFHNVDFQQKRRNVNDISSKSNKYCDYV